MQNLIISSLSLCSFPSWNSRPVEVASNGLATSGVASVFSTAIFLSFLPPCSEYPRSSADINWPKRWYNRLPISTRLRQSRVLSVLSSISWLRANSFFSTRVISLQLPLDFFLTFKNTSFVHVTSFDNHQFENCTYIIKLKFSLILT